MVFKCSKIISAFRSTQVSFFNRKLCREKPSDLRVNLHPDAKSSRYANRSSKHGKLLLQLGKKFFPTSSLQYDLQKKGYEKQLYMEEYIEKEKAAPFSILEEGKEGNTYKLGKSQIEKKSLMPSCERYNEEGYPESSKEVSLLRMSEESVHIGKQKNKIHRNLWIYLKNRRWRDWENTLEIFRNPKYPPDEVSFTLMLHGVILCPQNDIDEAWEILKEMKESKVHPILVRFNEALISAYSELFSRDAAPGERVWKKVLRQAWLIAALVKKRREHYIERINVFLSKEDYLKAQPLDIHTLANLWHNEVDPLLPADFPQIKL